MAEITNNFKVWAEDLINNPTAIPSVSDFTGDTASDRKDGFKPNTAASSQWANAGLRQANLFVASFMEAAKDMGVDISNVNFSSSVNDLKGLISQFIGKGQRRYRHRFSIKTASSASPSAYFDTTFYIDNGSSDRIINIFPVPPSIENQMIQLADYLYAQGFDAGDPVLGCNGLVLVGTGSSGVSSLLVKDVYFSYGIGGNNNHELFIYYLKLDNITIQTETDYLKRVGYVKLASDIVVGETSLVYSIGETIIDLGADS